MTKQAGRMIVASRDRDTITRNANGEAIAERAMVGSEPLTGIRVLVVEDSWQVAEGLRSLLLACGAEVLGPVPTTADAQRLFSEHDPDVALVDLNLRGGELAHNLIDWLHEKGARVIVTTGYSDVQVPKAATILRKPIDKAQLIGALNPGPT